jgi:hypothetical protein
MADVRRVAGLRHEEARGEDMESARKTLRCSTPAPAACQVLIVEDEGLVAKDLARALFRLGHNVVGKAATGMTPSALHCCIGQT